MNQNLNLSQNISASYHHQATGGGSKKPHYFPNQQQNASFHHHHQNTGESSYQPSKQPSQKTNGQKSQNNANNQHMQMSNQSQLTRNPNELGLSAVKNRQQMGSGNSGIQTSGGGESRQKNYKNGNVAGMIGGLSQNQKNVMLSSQTPAQMSHKQSTNKQQKYSTPTNVGQNQKYLMNQNSKAHLNQNEIIQTKKQKIQSSQKKKNYEVTLRLLEGKIIRDYSKLVFTMSTYLTVNLKKGKENFKTQRQEGKNPKWNESFKFEVSNIGDVAEVTLYNKLTSLHSEEKLGFLVLSLENLENYNTTDWFILYDDKTQQVGSVLINLTSEEIVNGKSSNQDKKTANNSIDRQPQSHTDEGDLDENDVGEELDQSLDYRDHEISRSLVQRNQIKGYNDRSVSRNVGMQGFSSTNGQGIYKGLHTQQQHQNSASYLHTQTNQPRQSVTENSVIRHYSSHSSQNNFNDNSDIDIDSPNNKPNGGPSRPHSYYQKQNQNISQNQQQINTSAGGMRTRNIKNGQIFHPNFTANDEEEILPQQLFYGKNQQQNSNSRNNLMAMQSQQQQPRYINPNNLSNQQYLYLDDLSNGEVGNNHNHQHKQHCKKSKERSSRRTKKHQHHQKDKNKKHHQLLEVEQFVDDIQQNLEGQYEEEDEVNYGNYLNQRSQAVVQQPISTSQSQQLLSAFGKHHNYESGGATSNSGGQQQLYQLTNMGLSGSGGNGMIVGSSGSYLPTSNMMGPSYFEDQNSIESINDAVIANHQIISGGPMHHHNQHNMMRGQGKSLYDISELQDIEQAKLQLLEENQIMSQQEQQLQQFFAQYNQNKAHLNKEIHMFKEQEKQFSDMKKNFQNQIDEFSKQKRQLVAQKKEFKYQKQQLERRFFNMKRERILITQKQKSIDDLYSQFNDLVNTSQILKKQQVIQAIPQKIDEFIGLMKNINYNLQVLNTSDKFQELDRLMQEELIYQQQQQLQGHIQQESTSSCATNSTGNYNFLLQGGNLFNNQNKSPINQSSPYSLQMQQHNQQLAGQQFGQNNLGNNILRPTSKNHLQIGSSNISQSSPKVITDLINTEEEDFLDQEELFKKHSPRIEDDYTNPDFNSNFNQNKSVDKKKFFMKSNKSHFLNEQHELSTIMEKELLTSQRRSSNGGAVFGTNTTIDANFRSNPHQLVGTQQIQINQNLLNQNMNQPSASQFQLQQVNMQNIENEEQKEQSLQVATKLAELEGFKKAYAEKLAYLSTLEQQLLKSAEDKINGSMLNQQQNALQITSQQINQNGYENYQHQLSINEEIVHITASEVPTNHNTSQIYPPPYIMQNDINHPHLHQQLQEIHKEQVQSQNIALKTQSVNQNIVPPAVLEESMEFIPDPNFLSKINQNMQMNDGKFGQNNNQPPVKQQNQIDNLQINAQLFYDEDGGDDNEEEEDQHYAQAVQQQPLQQFQYMLDNNQGIMHPDLQQQQVIIDHEDGFDPSDANNMINPDGLMMTEQQFMQMYGQQLNMQQFNQEQFMQLDGQNQYAYDPISQVGTFQNDQNQYHDFGEALNEETDYLQNYDCGGTIMHNNKLQPSDQDNFMQQNLIVQTANQIPLNEFKNSKLDQPSQNIQQTQQISTSQETQQKPKTKKEKLPEEEIQRLYHQELQNAELNKDVSVIYTQDGKVFDQPKKAQYGIQAIKVDF
eukprot:403331316